MSHNQTTKIDKIADRIMVVAIRNGAPFSQSELLSLLSGRKQDKLKAFAELRSRGMIVVASGTGTKGCPYRYRPSASRTHGTSELKHAADTDSVPQPPTASEPELNDDEFKLLVEVFGLLAKMQHLDKGRSNAAGDWNSEPLENHDKTA